MRSDLGKSHEHPCSDLWSSTREAQVHLLAQPVLESGEYLWLSLFDCIVVGLPGSSTRLPAGTPWFSGTAAYQLVYIKTKYGLKLLPTPLRRPHNILLGALLCICNTDISYFNWNQLAGYHVFPGGSCAWSSFYAKQRDGRIPPLSHTISAYVEADYILLIFW